MSARSKASSRSPAKAGSRRRGLSPPRRYVLRVSTDRSRVPWPPLKMFLCRKFKRPPPEPTALAQALKGFELDLDTDELRVIEAA